MQSSPHSGRATVIGRSFGLINLGAMLGLVSSLAVIRGAVPRMPHDDTRPADLRSGAPDASFGRVRESVQRRLHARGWLG